MEISQEIAFKYNNDKNNVFNKGFNNDTIHIYLLVEL